MNEILADNTMSLYIDKKIVFSFYDFFNTTMFIKLNIFSFDNIPQDDRDILKDEKCIDDVN